MHVIRPCIVAQLMTLFCYFQRLPDSKGFLLSEKPSQGITQVDQKVRNAGKPNCITM